MRLSRVTLADGTKVAARHKIDGGPSVLFDAVAIIVSEEGAAELAADAAAKDFVSDAFAHCKFIGMTAEAAAIFAAVGLADDLDDACMLLEKAGDVAPFIEAARALRFWRRELQVDLDAAPAPKA